MTTVTREHLAGLRLAKAEIGEFNVSAKAAADYCLDPLIAQATAEPAGVAVVFPPKRQIAGHLTAAESYRASGRNELLDEIAQLGPLYTHADPSEVERLKAELKAWMNAEAEKGIELVQLRQKLAEAQVLLRVHRERISTICAHSLTKPAEWCENFKGEIHGGIAKIDAFLSATARPADGVKS